MMTCPPEYGVSKNSNYPPITASELLDKRLEETGLTKAQYF
tara:strand:+ start:413 stop:535 length:123 start_codon:yes stop_codon:yes gene_type:complete